MEGEERTSTLGERLPYNKTTEAASGMTKEEYEQLFRYRTQTEKKTTHLAEELLYFMKDGKRTFIKDINEDAYNNIKEVLAEAPAWTPEQMETAKMIELELRRRSHDAEIGSEEWTDWLKILNEHQITGGQAIQALSKWARSDNDHGQVTEREAIDTIQASNLSEQEKKDLIRRVVELGGQIDQAQDAETLQDIILEIARERGTTTGFLAKRLTGVLRGAMRSMSINELKQFAFSSAAALSTDASPLNLGDAIKTIQVLNMLSSFKTPGRNLTGNTGFYALDALAMDGAAMLDMALANATGTRSVAMGGSPMNRAMWRSAIKSMEMSVLESALDVDMGRGETMYGTGGRRTFRANARRSGTGIGTKALNFSERVLSALERNQSYLLTVPDEFFKGLARSNQDRLQSLIDQGKIKTENENYAREQADALAKYRTFQDTSTTAAISMGLHDLLNLLPGFGDSGKQMMGKPVHAAGVGDLVSPFARVAANLASRVADYNPVTAAKGVLEIGNILYDAKVGKKPIDPARQAQAVSKTARGLTGTAVIGVFYMLLSAGLIRRADDEGDENVAALNRSEGRTGLQFNLSATARAIKGGDQKWKNGDRLLDISAFQPFNSFIGIADQIYQDEKKSPVSLLKDNALGMMYAAADIPMLQTAGELAKDLYVYQNDPAEALSKAAANTVVSSLTPNLMRSVAQGMDDRPRTIDRENGLWKLIQDEAKSRVPGLRQTLPGSVDPTGQPKTYQGSKIGHFLNSTINPFGLNTLDQTEQSQEWQRLREETGRTDFYPSSRIPKTLSMDGEEIELTREQRQQYQADRGGYLMSTAADMMGLAGYKQADAQRQSDLMKEVRDYANQAARAEILGRDSVDGWVLKAMDAQKDMGVSPAEYLLYRNMREDLDGSGSISQAEATQALISLQGVSNEQKGQMWAAENPKTNPAQNPFTGAMAEKDYSPEDALAFWNIYNGKGTEKDPYTASEKKQDIAEELDISMQKARELYRLMQAALEN